MNAEELQARLDLLPPQPTPVPPRPALPAAGPAVQQALASLRLVPAPADTDAERERRALALRKRRIVEERAKLSPRLRHAELAAHLRRLDTRCALLLGPSGVGKTGCALWAAARHRGSWVHARDLGACERRHPLGEGTPALLRTALTTRVLYVDDLGTEDSRDLGVLQYVIDQRYAAGLAMFVTCGLDREGLSTYLGAPYVRRLVEQHVTRADGSEWPVLFFDAHAKSPERNAP